MLVVFVCVCVCVWHFQVLLYCCSVMFVQRRCIQCFVMLLHCIDVCVWCMFLPHVPHVHGPGFSSMSPERRSRAAGSQPGFWHPGPKKTAAGSLSGTGIDVVVSQELDSSPAHHLEVTTSGSEISVANRYRFPCLFRYLSV